MDLKGGGSMRHDPVFFLILQGLNAGAMEIDENFQS
jgi:hypothetical protein